MPAPQAIVGALADRYGRLSSPTAGLDPFEALVATVFDRLLDPKRAEAARNALREDGLLDAQTLAEAGLDELAESLRSAGIKVPAKGLAPLRKLAVWLVERHHGDASEAPTAQLRDDLIAIPGVGRATADALLLFAFGRPSYPLNHATYRIFLRHGWLDTSADYDEARDVVEGLSPDDAAGLVELSLGFERLGKDHCRPSVAKCDRCPLAPFLPEGGPIEPG